VTTDGISARQLDAYFARRHLAEARNAWTGPLVQSYRGWVNTQWAKYLDDGKRLLLSPRQARALWRQVVERSSVADRLIGSGNAAAWAQAASQRLRDWNLDYRDLDAREDDLDFRSFLDWEAAYRASLADANWLDPGDGEIRLQNHPGSLGSSLSGTTVWADLEPTPTRDRLAERLQRDGHTVARWEPEAVNGSCQRIRLPDIDDELRAAGEWGLEKLREGPDRRIAIVIPGLSTRRDAVHRTLEDVLSPSQAALGGEKELPFTDLTGRPAGATPIIGAALTALELFSRRGRFASLSRWLRSPFFVTEVREVADRAMLETRLRLETSAQLGFLEAYQRAGLGTRIAALDPNLAAIFDAAVKLMRGVPDRATPTHWAGIWRRLLTRLGWPGAANGWGAPDLDSWESALNELALLTPVVGSVSATQALGELEAILREPQRVGPSRLRGLFLLERPEDVAAGYDGAWVTGLSDAQWPRPARPNPLLPLSLQRDHEMPLASPKQALEHSQRTTARLIARVPEVVLSWPARLHEYPTQPSPLIVPIPEMTDTGPWLRSPAGLGGADLPGARPRQTLTDVPPPLPDGRIRGGSHTLSLQAVCPLRAFLESRLAAKRLDGVSRGLSARQRGIAVHRATELLLQDLPAQSELAAWTPLEREARVEASVEKALGEVFGSARNALGLIFELESQSMRPLAAALLELDLSRTGFSVRSVEKRELVKLGDCELNCRTDRIDLLAPEGEPAGLAVIDYKTGIGSRPTDWLKPRPRDVQLPLYTLVPGEPVAAVVIAVLRPESVQYKGLWPEPGTFPGRATRLPKGRTWASQVELWREQLEALAREFARGDTRVFEAELDSARGPFAPLTRVLEQEALSKGWLDSWGPE